MLVEKLGAWWIGFGWICVDLVGLRRAKGQYLGLVEISSRMKERKAWTYVCIVYDLRN